MHEKLEQFNKIIKQYFDYGFWLNVSITLIVLIFILVDLVKNEYALFFIRVIAIPILALQWYEFFNFKIEMRKIYVEIRDYINRYLKKAEKQEDKEHDKINQEIISEIPIVQDACGCGGCGHDFH